MQTSLELEFGDGSYLFDLKLPQILELQRLCGAGIFTIYGRVLKGRYVAADQQFGVPHESDAFINDILETIRLGLIGGGKGIVNGAEVEVSVLRAKQLMETYAHPQPLHEIWDIAAAVLSAKVEGYEPQKKSPEPEAPAKPRKATIRRK